MTESDAERIETNPAAVAASHATKGWDNNALIDRDDLRDDLAVLRIRPDGASLRFRARFHLGESGDG